MDFSNFLHYVPFKYHTCYSIIHKKLIGNMSLRYLWVCEMSLLISHALIPHPLLVLLLLIFQTSPRLQNKYKNCCASVEYKQLLLYD